MLPVIAIVGRPNVGKSTLFNRLTKTRDAIVADLPGVTRDRLYGEGQVGEQRFIVIDTGGLAGDAQNNLAGLTEQQTWLAVNEADAILFLVDARSGLSGADATILQRLRQTAKPIYLVINKAENLNAEVARNEFYQLGLDNIFPISAAHGEGIAALMQQVLTKFPETSAEPEAATGIKIAIIGRPNVGKSTLVNRILGEERVLVYDLPGTTRDSIYIPFQRDNKTYTLIDTAGVRRRRGITEAVEKFSVIKALQAIDAANVVVMVLDAHESVAEQDLRLLGFIIEAGKALVIAVNKWDGLDNEQRTAIKNQLDRRLDFVNFARIHFISALHGSNVNDLFTSISEAYRAAMEELPTPELTRVLQQAVNAHQPPAPQGREIKLRYAHAGGHNPPVIVIHGKYLKKLPESYRRYLVNFFRNALKLVGTPIRIVFKSEK